MLAEGVVVARAFPPYDPWVRITIGLPAENDQARAALRKVLATKP
jgi:histidinol-phosphate aminotransferase